MSTAIIKPQWSPLTIALMVLGFIVFWPLGLAMLAYIVWGEMFGGTADQVQRLVGKTRGWCSPGSRQKWSNRSFTMGSSGNAAFDDYRAEQLRRLDEERKRLDEEIGAFQEYMRNLHMARDREEFDRFMRDRNGSRQGYTSSADNGQGASGGDNAGSSGNWGDRNS